MARIRIATCLGLFAALLMSSLPALASTTRPVVRAFALVAATGEIIKASDHVTGVDHVGVGLYEVAFDIKVNQCAWLAGVVYPGTPGGGGAQTGHSTSAKKILVRTGSGGGARRRQPGRG